MGLDAALPLSHEELVELEQDVADAAKVYATRTVQREEFAKDPRAFLDAALADEVNVLVLEGDKVHSTITTFMAPIPEYDGPRLLATIRAKDEQIEKLEAACKEAILLLHSGRPTLSVIILLADAVAPKVQTP